MVKYIVIEASSTDKDAFHRPILFSYGDCGSELLILYYCRYCY